MEAPLHKVAIIVTRTRACGPELLVFDHDRSGVQIPAGSVEPGEDITAAAKRELHEEAGLTVDALELLTSFRNNSKADERYCYVSTKFALESTLELKESRSVPAFTSDAANG